MDKAGIRDQFKKTLGRNDITDDLANTFIDQAVARIQRTLRVPAMEKIADYEVNADQPSVFLPNDFLSMKLFYSGERNLDFLPLSSFLTKPKTFGSPVYYTRVGAELRLWPQPVDGTELSLVYFGEIPDLVNDQDTNFLCVIAPDLLVYGALTFAADYYVDDRKPAFEDAFARIYAEVEEQARLVEMEQSGMAISMPTDLEF